MIDQAVEWHGVCDGLTVHDDGDSQESLVLWCLRRSWHTLDTMQLATSLTSVEETGELKLAILLIYFFAYFFCCCFVVHRLIVQ